MRRLTSSSSGSINGWATISERRKSAKTKRSARMVVEYGIKVAPSSRKCFTGNASFHLAAPVLACLLPRPVLFLRRLNVTEAGIQGQIIRDLHPSRQEKREIEESGSQQGAGERRREGAACRAGDGRD